MMLKKSLIVIGTATIALAACAPASNINPPQYWQRLSASESTLQQGPKAQQMLDRDIGRCVVELHELESLGAIKDPIPTDTRGRVLGPDEIPEKDYWTLPQRESALTPTEDTFDDFIGCMQAKGWERVYKSGTSLMRTRAMQVPD
jgi:hypothetical protein